MRILLAEHETALCRLVESLLSKWGHDAVVAHDVNEVWSAFYEADLPDLVILDWMMPDLDGAKLCQRIRERTDDSYVYVLMLTAEERRQDIVDGMGAGSDDYITKPFDARELRARLRVGQRILELQMSLLATQNAAKAQAARDALTGMWTSDVVMDILKGEMNRTRREWISLSVIATRIEGLDRVRETMGSQAYEETIKEVAKRIRDSVRSYDVLGRYGEREFLALVPGCDEDRAQIVVDRIRRITNGESFGTSEGNVPLKVSMGIASLSGEQTIDPAHFVRSAEDALERAKSQSEELT